MSVLAFDQADQLREFFFAMIESIPGGLLLADRRGELLAANRQAAELLGFAGSSIAGRSCWELLAAKLGLAAAELQPLQRPGGRLLVEQRGEEGAGERYLLIARNELNSPFFAVAGFFLSLEDVTYPAMVEAQLDRRKRFAAIQDLAVSLSQELRNPLGGLELYASMLRRELGDDPDYQRITTRMLAAIGTINHLLDNALIFATQPRPEKRPLAIEPLLNKVLGSLAPLAEAGGIKLASHFAHEQRELVADPGLLEQMLLNLGVNAIESMNAYVPLNRQVGTPGERLREVELATRVVRAGGKAPEMLELRWLDRGRGVAPEIRERIFDPFFSTKNGGKGLGLAIVHHIVESHQGFVRVDGRPGGGSVFTVLLPLD